MITAAVAAPVTFVIVLAMSTIVEIGANTTTNSIGKPSAANTAVDVIVLVPGTPTVPTDTTNVSGSEMHTVQFRNDILTYEH